MKDFYFKRMETWLKSEKMSIEKIKENSDIPVILNDDYLIFDLRKLPKGQYSFG